MTTNYTNTFITASPDSTAQRGAAPKAGTIAADQLQLLLDQPYAFTSDDILFRTHAARNNVAKADMVAARAAYFAVPKACLRASALVKTHGWGLHHDADSKVAAYSVESPAYQQFLKDPTITLRPGMRSKRK